MDIVRIPIARLSTLALPLPEYFSAGAAGMDLGAAVAAPVALAPGGFQLIPCGFAIALPAGLEAQIRPRSGLAARHGVTVLNAPGTIDSDYRGEVKVLLINHGPVEFSVQPGMRIAQMVVAPVARVAWEPAGSLAGTARGEGGFGHTGLQS
ncbi:MAG: dUTP diphosphatase [Acidobacteria bacterium]|nr:dUTP diphosphatase [Acidobacteriota bacterium]